MNFAEDVLNNELVIDPITSVMARKTAWEEFWTRDSGKLEAIAESIGKLRDEARPHPLDIIENDDAHYHVKLLRNNRCLGMGQDQQTPRVV